MRQRNVIALLLFVIYLGVVAWCCFGHFDDMPSVQKEIMGIPTDKLVHFAMFFPFPILGFLTFQSLSNGRIKPLLLVCVVLLAGLAVAAATEIGQSMTEYRSGDPMDFLADALSLTTASLAVLVVHLLRKNKKRT